MFGCEPPELLDLEPGRVSGNLVRHGSGSIGRAGGPCAVGVLGVPLGPVARQEVLGAQAPFISLVYRGPGVAVVGTSPDADRSPFSGPPQLYICTDMVHWASVAPPGTQSPMRSTYVWFDQASFISASTGWVSTWEPRPGRHRCLWLSRGGRL